MDQRTVAAKGRPDQRTAWLILWLCLLALPAGAEVYQWRDADGRLHFGDAPPEADSATNLSADYDHRAPFSMSIQGIDYRIPPALHNHLEVSVRKIFEIYRSAFGLKLDMEQEFRIVIYGTESAYRAYQRQISPVLENAAGFYNAGNNQITTWGMPERELLALVTHEASHAISASDQRWVPTWLNEGLAEYFEAMEVSGLGAQVHPHGYWLRMLSQRAPTDLLPFVNAAHQDWYRAGGGDGALAYATSWSLVFFLMETQPGRDLLRELLVRTRALPQPLRDSAAFIDRRWPGGMPALSAQWQQWLANADKRPHRY